MAKAAIFRDDGIFPLLAAGIAQAVTEAIASLLCTRTADPLHPNASALGATD